MLINQLGQSSTPLERTLGMPEGGPRCVPITLDFAVSASYTLDYGNMQQRNFLDMVQTVWVDNFGNGQVLTITVANLGMSIQVPAGVQGFFPVLCPNPVKLAFHSTGGTVQQVILCNFPVLT